MRFSSALNQKLSALRRQLPQLSQKYHVKSLSIFGSYAKHTQTKASDIDILVEFNETPTLFEFIKLENQLSRLLKMKVDLVTPKALRPQIGSRILKEIIAV
ncbi:MAG: nucleotidyltransferase family protein [Verrucomicrobiae bacterium]|nr:nucleotidyltransferase family protein [Verrucomicrobiae bacterium]